MIQIPIKKKYYTGEQVHELISLATFRNQGKMLWLLEKAAQMQAADVQEVKHGKWKQGCCSECGYNWGKDALIASVPNFCPNCGADMRKETEDAVG